MNGYPFTILDIAGILNLKIRRRQPTNIDVDCPFCGHKKGKMNINLTKNVFRCNYCGESGGMIELYSKVFRLAMSKAMQRFVRFSIAGRNRESYRNQSNSIHLIWSSYRKQIWKQDIRRIP